MAGIFLPRREVKGRPHVRVHCSAFFTSNRFWNSAANSPTGKPPKATDFEEYACALKKKKKQKALQREVWYVTFYYTNMWQLHITLHSRGWIRDPKTHTNLMQPKQVTTSPDLLILTEPNNMASNYFKSHNKIQQLQDRNRHGKFYESSFLHLGAVRV